MENPQDFDVAKDVLYLVSCALDECAPDAARVADMDLDALYRVARAHYLTALVATALVSAAVEDDAFAQAKGKAIRKAALFNMERAAILEKLEEAGIRYAPLKGAVLQDYYPELGLRQMSDNDILVDAERIGDVTAIMKGLGYELVHTGLVHLCFHKEPVLNFEMHTRLFDEHAWEALSGYFGDVWTRLVKDEGNGFGYHFSDEDFYLYQTAHEYKHYFGSGTGLRTIVDEYVFLREKQDSLDWVYVEGELEKFGAGEFEGCLRRLAVDVFAGKAREEGVGEGTSTGESSGEGASLGVALPEDEAQMIAYIAGCGGAYGSIPNRVSNSVERYGGGFSGKMRYVWHRLFPPLGDMKAAYPSIAKYPILIPLLPFFRLGRALTVRRKTFAVELRALRKVD